MPSLASLLFPCFWSCSPGPAWDSEATWPVSLGRWAQVPAAAAGGGLSNFPAVSVEKPKSYKFTFASLWRNLIYKFQSRDKNIFLSFEFFQKFKATSILVGIVAFEIIYWNMFRFYQLIEDMKQVCFAGGILFGVHGRNTASGSAREQLCRAWTRTHTCCPAGVSLSLPLEWSYLYRIWEGREVYY